MSSVTLVLSFLIGFGAGALHYQTLWYNLRRLATGGSAVRAVAIQLLRLAGIATVLIAAAWFGAFVLLATALGVLAARVLAIRLVGAAS